MHGVVVNFDYTEPQIPLNDGRHLISCSTSLFVYTEYIHLLVYILTCRYLPVYTYLQIPVDTYFYILNCIY